ncbi:MAG: bifunctional glutamate N-acetyltransferase/amino-acid acetyltransferase ArgJ [Lentisphaeria bacterium]|nr:bifunctional glutamate N-acetyltransferase/amino-acid acetyltransferase ArgJ [Lentisphaeria bacterium]
MKYPRQDVHIVCLTGYCWSAAMGQLTFHSETERHEWLRSQADLPAGFKAGVTSFTFKPREMNTTARMNLTLLTCDPPTEKFAAVFTRNAFPGAPVTIGRERLKEKKLGAVLVNNKISNVGAPDGVKNAETVCAAVAAALGIDPRAVLPGSTGVIGWRLPAEEIVAAVPALVKTCQDQSVLPAAEAIMTTDLYPKVRSVTIGDGRIVGIAKGAGMIEPNLATMLVYILTDVDVSRNDLRDCLARAVEESFNAISIDSDQSTSDTVVLISSGKAPCPDLEAFAHGLNSVCRKLAADIVRNGEGVKHVIRVTVTGAPDMIIAKGVGKSVINSPLVQCAVAGNDPNVGRVLMAVGKFIGNEHPDINAENCSISIGGQTVFANGVFQLDPDRETVLRAHLESAQLYESDPPDARGVFTPPVRFPPHEKTVDICVDLGCGGARFTVLGADRTHEYISENADYRS